MIVRNKKQISGLLLSIKRKTFGVFLFGVCTMACAGDEVVYPFELPLEISATAQVNTKKSTPINNQLLGLNANWPESLYGKVGFNHPDALKLVRSFRPSSLRFPHGVWSNFYDWECDGRRITDDYVTPYNSSVKKHPTLLYGFDGFYTLHKELNFDVLFTFNVNYDSPEKSARRLVDRREKGFAVKWVELGNEPFWKTQRSAAIKTVEDYIKVSKNHAAALKAVDPDIKVSVPIHWRNAISNPWNKPFMEEDYFDAITIHKHMNSDSSVDSLQKTLFTGLVLDEMADTLQTIFPDHPIWLSEWSTGEGENAISVLGLADGYLTLFEKQDVYEIASFFQLNASHPLFKYDKKTRVHTKTSFGAAYEMIRDLFESAELLECNVSSVALDAGKDAVRAVAVRKNDEIVVFAINKTPVAVPFALEIDGIKCDSSFQHQTLSFENVNEFKMFGMEECPYAEIKSNGGGVMLPPLSINRICRLPESGIAKLSSQKMIQVQQDKKIDE